MIDKGIQHSLLVGEILEKIKRENNDPYRGELADQNTTESEPNGSEELKPAVVDQDALQKREAQTEAPESQIEPTDPWVN